MKRDLQDFIDERAEHLAVVYLTSRQDLVIERMTMAADYGLDILVTILLDKAGSK
jgi:gluconate kinase